MFTINRKTKIFKQITEKEKLIQKSFLCFSWYEKQYAEKLRNDLIIYTDEEYDGIFIQYKDGQLTKIN